MKKQILSKLTTIHKDYSSSKDSTHLSIRNNEIKSKIQDISDILIKTVFNKTKSKILEGVVNKHLVINLPFKRQKRKSSSNFQSFFQRKNSNKIPTSPHRNSILQTKINNFYNSTKINSKFSGPINLKTDISPQKSIKFITRLSSIDSFGSKRNTISNYYSNSVKNLNELQSHELSTTRNEDISTLIQRKTKKDKVKTVNLDNIVSKESKEIIDEVPLSPKEKLKDPEKYQKIVLDHKRDPKKFIKKRTILIKDYKPPPLSLKRSFSNVGELNNFLIRDKKFSELKTNKSKYNTDLAEDFYEKQDEYKKMMLSKNFERSNKEFCNYGSKIIPDHELLAEYLHKESYFPKKEFEDQILDISLKEYEETKPVEFINYNNLNRILRVKEIMKNNIKNKGITHIPKKEIDKIKNEKIDNCGLLTKYKIYFPSPSFLKNKFKKSTLRTFKNIESNF